MPYLPPGICMHRLTVAQLSWDDLLVPDQVDAPVAGDDGQR